MTNTEHIAQEDLVLYALHALTPEEAAPIHAHLASCSLCSQEAAEATGDMALLALSVDQQPLPAGAQERFFAKLAAMPAPAHTSATSTATVMPFEAPLKTRRSVWPVFVPWAAAAALTAVCISLGVENRKLSDTVNTESALLSTLSSKASHAQQIVDALNSPHAQRVTLTAATHPPEPTGHAIYLADRGSLLFQADHLKPLEAGKTYELWVIPADGKAPIPAGTFTPDAVGYASVVLPELPPGVAAKAFGVTIENAGGSTTPTMPIVLAGG
jgi:anti-sigma-K factor RskA